MPRIIVVTDSPKHRGGTVTLDEQVEASELLERSLSAEMIRRIGSAVHDADEVERDHTDEGRSDRLEPEEDRAGAETPGHRAEEGADRGESLSKLTHAVREHENSTRGSLSRQRPVDLQLYRKLRRALDR